MVTNRGMSVSRERTERGSTRDNRDERQENNQGVGPIGIWQRQDVQGTAACFHGTLDYSVYRELIGSQTTWGWGEMQLRYLSKDLEEDDILSSSLRKVEIQPASASKACIPSPCPYNFTPLTDACRTDPVISPRKPCHNLPWATADGYDPQSCQLDQRRSENTMQ